MTSGFQVNAKRPVTTMRRSTESIRDSNLTPQTIQKPYPTIPLSLPPPMSLLHFPNELLLAVAESLNRADFNSFCKSNRRLHALLSAPLLEFIDQDTDEIFMFAAQKGLAKVVQEALERGANIVCTDQQKGRMALHWASGYGHVDVIDILLDNGADIGALDLYDHTPLHIAAIMAEKESIYLLLQRGADIAAHDESKKYTPLHVAVDSTSTEDEEVVRILLDAGAAIDAAGKDGYTPLLLAASNGYDKKAKLLLERGADITARTSKLNTVLHEAAQHGFEEAIRLFLEKGADVDAQNTNGDTALHLVARYEQDLGALFWAKKPAYGAAEKIAAGRGGTPGALVKQLLDNGASMEIANRNKDTALHLAAGNGRLATVKLFLERGVCVDPKGGDGYTPLLLAVSNQHETIIKLLLDAGADPNTSTNYLGSAIHRAAQVGSATIAKLILDRGAPVDARKQDQDTALHIAATNGHDSVVALLLERGALINEKGADGNTPLMLAASRGRVSTVKLLLERGADIKAVNNYLSTALHRAAYYGNLQVVKALLEKGPVVDAVNKEGKTPFQLAKPLGLKSVVELLLEAGADHAEPAIAGTDSSSVPVVSGGGSASTAQV